jgi:porphobilinogen deaminase
MTEFLVPMRTMATVITDVDFIIEADSVTEVVKIIDKMILDGTIDTAAHARKEVISTADIDYEFAGTITRVTSYKDLVKREEQS